MSTSSTTAAKGYLRLLAILVLATALGPFSMQVFLPALPAIQHSFGVSAALAQLAFSLSAFAIAISMLFYGPISDTIGRRPTMIGGIVIYLAGSVLCVMAPNIELLILGRIIQAAGGSAGMVLGRAIVRDLYNQEKSAQAIAYITMAMVAAPMVAPAIGGIVTEYASWTWTFGLSGLLGVIVLFAVLVALPETAPASGQRSSMSGTFRSFSTLIQIPAFRGYAGQCAFSISVFYTFLGAAPYVVLVIMERSASEYGLLFMLISGAFMIGNFLAARATARIGTQRMIVFGSWGAFLCAAGFLVLLLMGIEAAIVVFAPMACIAFFQGLSIPNGQAAVIGVRPQIAGAASGLSGFIQMGTGAIAAQIIGSIQVGSALPMAIGMVAFATLALLSACYAVYGAPKPS